MRINRQHVGGLILTIAIVGGISGCKTVTAAGTPNTPTLTFSQATNASLQAAHKFGVDVAASVQSGRLVLTPGEKQAFDAFAASLNTTDALFIAYTQGSATQAQVTTALANTTTLQTSAQTALAGGN